MPFQFVRSDGTVDGSDESAEHVLAGLVSVQPPRR